MAADAGVGVLAVVDRVLGVLRDQQVEVELDQSGRASAAPARSRAASTPIRSISSSSVTHRPAALRPIRPPLTLHQLVDLDVDPVGVVAERHGAGLEPADVAVVVGAEHVHGDVEAALELRDDVARGRRRSSSARRSSGRSRGPCRRRTRSPETTGRRPARTCGRRPSAARSPGRPSRPRTATARGTSCRTRPGTARASPGSGRSSRRCRRASTPRPARPRAAPARRRSRPRTRRGSRPRAPPRRAPAPAATRRTGRSGGRRR